MEPLVSMTVGIVLISKTAKKHRESAKRVVIPAGMDRTAIIVSIPKKKISNEFNFVILVKMKFLPKEFDTSSRAQILRIVLFKFIFYIFFKISSKRRNTVRYGPNNFFIVSLQPVLLGHTAERATKSAVIVQIAPPVTQRRGRVLMGVTRGICRTAATCVRQK